MNKKSKKVMGILSAVLVLAIVIGGTLAYLTRETETKSNNFSFARSDEGLNAKLTEPEWDGIIDYVDGKDVYDYIDNDSDPETPDVPVYGYEDGDKSKPITDPDDNTGTKPTFDSTDPTYTPEYGEELGQKMIPGQEAPKNPFITNTTSMNDEWVALRITFVYAAGHADAGKQLTTADLKKVTDVMEIDYNDTTWDRIEGLETSIIQTFYFKSIINRVAADALPGVYGGATDPIFNSVTLSEDATNDQIDALVGIGGFDIFVEGFAAQSDVAADYAAFKVWGFDDAGVVFTNTPDVA